MKYPFIYRIIAPIILVVFTITSCNYFVLPEPGEIRVPIGKGDIRFIYLDENYQPTTNDIGRMAMYVEKNDLTRNVLVLSEIPDNNIDNDVVVRVINKENNSKVSFFYFSGQNFPHRIVMTMDGNTAIGDFSLYNPVTETYSVVFSSEESENEFYNNLILNKNVFSLHEYSNELTETQNVRLRNIITTLALWNSLAFQIDDGFDVGARGISWKSFFKSVVKVVAVVAVAAVIILAPPAAVAVVGGALVVSVVTVPQVIAAAVAVVAIVVDSFIDDSPDNPAHNLPPPSDDKSRVAITLDGNGIPNNGKLRYIGHEESLTFNIKITNLGLVEHKKIIDMENLYKIIDPNTGKIADNQKLDFFNVNTNGDIRDIVQFKISRNDIIDEYTTDGRVQIVIRFGRNVVINDVESGIDFKNIISGTDEKDVKNIFVLNFTLEPMVEIMINNIKIINNDESSQHQFYYENSLTLSIKFTDLADKRLEDIIDVGVIDNLRKWFDTSVSPGKFIGNTEHNAGFFNVNVEDIGNNFLDITVKKEERGHFASGKVQLIIQFRTDVIINGTGTGINFRNEATGNDEVRGNIFVLNLVALPDPDL